MSDSTNGPIDRGVVPAAGPHAEDDPTAIRADIGETRRRMSHALDEIGERMNPHHLKEQVKHSVRDATIGRAENMARNTAMRAREARYTILDTIRDNPLPAAITGLGLGWLAWNGRKHDAHRTDRYGYGLWEDDAYLTQRARPAYGYPTGTRSFAGSTDEPSEGLRDKVEDIGHRTMDAVHDAGDRTREMAGELADRTQDLAERTVAGTRSAAQRIADETRFRSHRLEDRLEETLRSNPLAIGAAAAALGLAVGLSAPATQREAELMGEARDRLRDRARHATQQTVRKATHVAEEAVHQASEAARDTARREGLTH